MNEKTDKERIKAVFVDLRRKGFMARMNYLCCQTCGNYAMEQMIDKRGLDQDTTPIIFYHQQDAEAFDSHGWLKNSGMYMTHTIPSEIAAMDIIAAFTDQGLPIDWDFSPSKRIKVMTSVGFDF